MIFSSLPLFLLALLSLSPTSTLASSKSEPFLLSNGLRVVFKRDASFPLVALQLWVEAGAADEVAEEAGIAHVLEHILFRGSSEHGTGKFAGEVENLGGRMNGFTSHDRTVYHLVLPAAHAKSGLRLLAQMMQLPSLNESELKQEIQVVLEEWKQGEDNPRSRANRAIFEAAYKLHPYGRPVIGTPDTLNQLSWEAVERFYRGWYTAPNMTLVVVGDLESQGLKEDAAELFGFLPGHPLPKRQRGREAPQVEPRLNIIKAPIRQSYLTIGFPIPSATEKSAAALDLLAFILGRGESSRLAQRVKIDAGWVTSISASTFSAKEPGLFLIHGQLETEKIMDALKAILKEVYRLREETVSSSELTWAHVNFARTFVGVRETVDGQARQIGGFQSLHGNPDYEEIYLRAVRELDDERLKTTAQTFFKSEGLSISLVVPERASGLPKVEEIADLSRSLEDVVIVRREHGILKATLQNGLRIQIQEDRRLPLVSLYAGVIGGLLLEDEGNNGIHNFIASMLTQGTPRLSSSQLVHEVEQLGGSLSGSSGNSTLSLSGAFPSQEAEKGLEIFLDTLFHPSFPEAQLEKKRREILVNIDTREERVRNRAFRLFYQNLFRSHPYRLQPSGEREQVQRFTREDLISHYQRLVSPDRVVLTIVGDVDGEKVLKVLQGKLSALPKIPTSFSLPSADDGSAGKTEGRGEKRSAKTKQAHLVLGFPAPARGQPDYFAMKVLEVILSRLGGRLFVELRDKQGLAYSVGAFSGDSPFQGVFGIYAATDPSKTDKMRQGIVWELTRLHEEEVSAQELERAKNYLIGNYHISRQTNASRASDLTFNELFGFGADFARRYEDEIKKVNSTDIQKFVRQYLPLDRYVLAIVGP